MVNWGDEENLCWILTDSVLFHVSPSAEQSLYQDKDPMLSDISVPGGVGWCLTQGVMSRAGHWGTPDGVVHQTAWGATPVPGGTGWGLIWGIVLHAGH